MAQRTVRLSDDLARQLDEVARVGGNPLRLARDYISHGIRTHAEDICTAQLGYRTEHDIKEAKQREVEQQRFTSLDRVLSRANNTGHHSIDRPDYFALVSPVEQHLSARLHVLQKMGLAEQVSGAKWRVRSDFEHVLRSMQTTIDRQKMLAANATLLSDERLPLTVTPISRIKWLEGRVLGHVLDDSTGRIHMLLEGTDARVHFIAHPVD